MEGVGVDPVRSGAGQVVGRPHFEVGQGQLVLDEVDHHARELDPVPATEIDRLAIQDRIHRSIEVLWIHQANEVRDLVEPVRLVQRAKSVDSVRGDGHVVLRPLAGDVDGTLREEGTEPTTKVRFAVSPLSRRRMSRRVEQPSQ